MKCNLTTTLIAIALFTCSFGALAAKQPVDDGGWSWSGNIDSMHINKDKAAREYIGDTAVVFGLAAEHYSSSNEFTYALGVNFIAYDDQAGFSQSTNKGRKSSDASGILLYVEAGPRYHFGADGMNFVVVKGGLSTMVSSDRGIGYCTNCYSEKIDVNGGAYGVLGVGHTFNSFDVALNFQQYFSGDIDNSLSIKLSSSF